MADSRFFVDIMRDIVDSMREFGTIKASSESSSVYTLTYTRGQEFSTNTLQDDYHVTIDSIDYQISNLTTTTFDITAQTGLDFTGKSWKALEPYYMYGHYVEVANVLRLKDDDPTEKDKKFPLIYLVTDFSEDHSDEVNIDYTVSPTILIICSTDKDYLAEDRYENKFKPILYPYYEILKLKMDKAPGLITVSQNQIEHTKTDRLFWGVSSENGNTSLIFNEYNDAIELNFNDITVATSIFSTCL
jgi:hypothetical protein